MEKYSILIKDASIVVKPGKTIRRGYVYINKGTIVDVGEGEVPEDYEFANYVIEGKGRIVLPGVVCPLTTLSAYPSRFGGERASSSEELYYASKMALQELLLHGVTTVGTVEKKGEPVIRAMVDSGIRGVLFLDTSEPTWKDQFAVLMNRWNGYEGRIKIGLADLEGKEEVIELAKKANIPVISVKEDEYVIYVRESRDFAKGRGVLELRKGDTKALGYSEAAKNLDPLSLVRALYMFGGKPEELLEMITVNAAKILGFDNIGTIERGKRADVLILDASEPPGWNAGRGEAIDVIIASAPKVESVIIDGEMVVDISESLNIGVNDVKRAKKLFEK